MKVNNKFKIAIQKDGRLTQNSMDLLKDIGLMFEEYNRQLYSNCSNFDASILYTRDDNIPEFVESGIADIGIVGSDLLQEEDCEVEIVKGLGFGKCRIVVAAREGMTLEDLNGKKIATSYPKIAKKFFDSKKLKVGIIEIKGGVEIAPNIGLADGIVDIVSSGFTLKVNNLVVVSEISEEESVIICNPNLKPDKRVVLEKLLFRIDALKRAENYKYILMNVPENKLKDIVKILPGLKSPTTAKLAIDGWLSVQTVIDEKRFWELIDQLREAGAQGILVLPIEKVIT